MKNKIAFILCFASVILSGCSEKIEGLPDNSEDIHITETNAPELLISETEAEVLIDAEIDVPDGFTYILPTPQVRLKAFDSSEIVQILGMDTVGITPKQSEIEMYGSKYDNTIYFDGNNDLISSYMIFYQSEEGQIYPYLFQKELFTEKKDLKFADEVTARQNIADTLDDLGLEGYIFQKTYYMDYEKLRAAEQEKEKDKYFEEDLKAGRIPYRGNWNENDGCYVFDICFTKNQIPVQSNDYLIEDTFFMVGNSVRVYYSKEGIIEFELSAYYECIDEGEQIEILKPEKIQEAVEKKFHSAIISDKITVTKMNLEYQPKRIKEDGSHMVLWPAWAVSFTQGNSHEENVIYFDAESGKEIIN